MISARFLRSCASTRSSPPCCAPTRSRPRATSSSSSTARPQKRAEVRARRASRNSVLRSRQDRAARRSDRRRRVGEARRADASQGRHGADVQRDAERRERLHRRRHLLPDGQEQRRRRRSPHPPALRILPCPPRCAPRSRRDFDRRDRAARSRPTRMRARAGNVQHAGNEVRSGERFILVGFYGKPNMTDPAPESPPSTCAPPISARDVGAILGATSQCNLGAISAAWRRPTPADQGVLASFFGFNCASQRAAQGKGAKDKGRKARGRTALPWPSRSPAAHRRRRRHHARACVARAGRRVGAPRSDRRPRRRRLAKRLRVGRRHVGRRAASEARPDPPRDRRAHGAERREGRLRGHARHLEDARLDRRAGAARPPTTSYHLSRARRASW